jgi:hypothetical protein
MDPSLLGRPIPTPTTQKPAGLVTKKTLVIILLLIGALIGGALFLIGGSDNTGALLQRTSARQATMQRLVADGQKNLTSDDLGKINSELNILLAGSTPILQAEVSKAGIKKMDAQIVAAEADTDTFEKLASAKLNGQYDATYRNVLSNKLESMLAILEELHGKTKSKSLKATLALEHKQLSTYSKALETLPAN